MVDGQPIAAVESLSSEDEIQEDKTTKPTTKAAPKVEPKKKEKAASPKQVAQEDSDSY